MTTATTIRNHTPEPATLPYPLRGVLKPGQTICLAETKASLLALCPGLGDTFKLNEITSSGPFDSSFGSTADDDAAASVAYLSTENKARLNRTQRGYLDVAARAGASPALVLADAGKLVTLSHGSAIAANIPLVAAQAWEVGDVIDFLNIGVGAATFSCTSGTIAAQVGKTLVSLGAGARVSAVMIAANSWIVSGDLVAA